MKNESETNMGVERSSAPAKGLYQRPTSGIVSILPDSLVPYAELMRISKPGGLYAFYFPHLFGIALAAKLLNIPPSDVLHIALLLLGVNVLLRGTACSWNDTIDADLDRQVERCRLRPVARGAVSEAEAHLFTAAQGLTLFLIVYSCFPEHCTGHLSVILLLYGIYPFCKRFTNFPQLVLGFPMAWGCWLGSQALGLDPFRREMRTPMLMLFAANVVWSVIYDTIYAHQDVKDDVKAGIKSTAVRFQKRTKAVCMTLSATMATLLVAAGIALEFGMPYFVLSCGCTGAVLVTMIYSVDLENPADCMWWFTNQFLWVGGSITAGLLAEYAVSRA